MRWLSSLFIMLSLLGCQQKGKEAVEILNGGIYTPISVEINGIPATDVFDIGEYETATEARNIIIRVRNNTMFPMTDMDFVFAPSATQAVSFLRSEEGQPKYPGAGGTCGATLLPGNTCIINLQYEAAASGVYTQPAKFEYKNLVEPDGRPITFTFLAGTAASLVFTEDKTRFVFGDEVGPTKIPVVERAVKQVYTRNLEVKNAGELSARDITLGLTQSCLSNVTNQCPDGMGEVYSITHNCPQRLLSGVTCNIIVNYAPKNQDPEVGPVPPEIVDIRYESTIKANYINNPDNDRAVLTGYFSSVSATIEARFETSIDNLIFETPIIAGNRALKQFRINNTGYREGELQKIIFTNIVGSHVATCIREDENNQYLKCFNQILTEAKTLEELPFFLKDRNDCVSVHNGADKTYTNVGQSCVYDIYFQPSIKYLSEISFDLDMYAEYDTRWQNLEVIKQKELQLLSATAQSAARLVVTSVKIGPMDYVSSLEPATIDPYKSYTYNFGRLALLSPAYFKRKPFTITLRNEGQFSAKNLVFKDGRNTTIPYQGTNPLGVDLGVHNIKYFSGTMVDDLGCTEIPPGGSCTIKSNFAPIGLNDELKQMENMFDELIGNQTDFVKKFIVTYDDGAFYQDETLVSTVRDIPLRTLQSKIKATLVTKGVMSDYSNENTFKNGPQTFGNKRTDVWIFRNIGTGPMSYMPYVGNESFPRRELFLERTTNLNLHDADFDCLDMFDFSYNPADSIATIQSRMGTWSTYPTSLNTESGWHALPAEKSCALTLVHQGKESAKTILESGMDSLELTTYSGELGRFFSQFESGNNLWEYPRQSNFNFDFQVDYFDGDNTDPAVVGDPIRGVLGSYQSTLKKTIGGGDLGYAKVIPVNFYPQTAALMYRPGFTLSNLVVGTVNKPGKVIPPFWAIGPMNAIINDPQYTPFMKGFHSQTHISPDLGSLPGGYDYVVYLGTYPVGENHIASVKLSNRGASGADLTNTYFETAVSPLSLASGEISGVDSLFIAAASPSAAGLEVSDIGNTLGIRFNPSGPGRFTNMLTYTYTTGEFVNSVSGAQRTKTIKVLVVADAMSVFPNLSVDVYDFDVVEQDGVAPLVTMNPSPTSINPTSNNNSATPPKVTLSSIKLSSPTSNDTFVKKRIVFKNTSATQKLYNLKINLKASTTALTALTSIFVGTASLDQSNCTAAFSNSREGNGLASLNEAGTPGDSCYIEIRYQPKLTDAPRNTLLSFMYELKPNQYIEKHIAVELAPVDPATVAVVDGPSTTLSREDVYDEFGNTIPGSHPLSFGTQIMNADPMPLNFNQGSGTFKRLTVSNAGVTKASFLKAYHDYLDEHNPAYAGPILPGTNVIPAPGDYVTGGDGYEYTTIYLKKYTTGEKRVEVRASRACLFGDDESNGLVPWFQKGFNASTTTPCFLEIYFNADINYAAREILIKQPTRMKDNYFRLRYYNYNRSSVSQIPLYFHLKGLIKPPVSGFASTPIFANVETKETGTATFSWSSMIGSAPVVGPIVGYRVYFSSSQGDITGDVYPLGTTKFVDTFDINARTRLFTGMQKGRFYYFRVVAIRQNSRYKAKYFPGLADGFFLSEVSPVNTTNYLRVTIPLAGTEYIHSLKLLVERGMYWPTPSTWATADTKCKTRTTAVLFNGTVSTPRPYSLLSKAAWDIIKFNPLYHEYSNFLQVPHWVSGGATYNISTYMGAQPGYNPAELTQTFPVSRLFYYRDSNSWNSLVAMAVGGVLDTDYSDYTSLVDSKAEFGVGRCMIVLP